MWRNLVGLAVLASLLGAAPPVLQPKDVKSAKRAWLGVQLGKNGTDIVVMLVLADSPAEKAKVLAGDILVSIHGIKPTTLVAAVRVIGGLKPRQKVKMVVKRDGRERELEVTLGEL
jgi:serine protease Do